MPDRRPTDLTSLQCTLGVQLGLAHRIAEIDRQVAELYADGYLVDADRLLDERGALDDARRELGLAGPEA